MLTNRRRKQVKILRLTITKHYKAVYTLNMLLWLWDSKFTVNKITSSTFPISSSTEKYSKEPQLKRTFFARFNTYLLKTVHKICKAPVTYSLYVLKFCARVKNNPRLWKIHDRFSLMGNIFWQNFLYWEFSYIADGSNIDCNRILQLISENLWKVWAYQIGKKRVDSELDFVL